MKKILLALCFIFCFSGACWGQTSLTGLWIDSRTGNDFWEINGTEEAFRFIAYGGNPSTPRYLSRGVALALEPGVMRATMRDLPEYCCAQQASLEIRVVSASQLQVAGQYRDADGTAAEVNFVLSRAGAPTGAPTLPLPSITYDEPMELSPGATTATWDGAWHGDGWASFFMVQRENKLYMYWYYSKQSPFFGEYQLGDDGIARGVAVALIDSPGNTYYYQELKLSGKQVQMSSRRLLAPLEDGRWVRFSNAALTSVVMNKINDALPVAETAYLQQWFSGHHPAEMFNSTLKQAEKQGKLLEREK